MFDRAFQPVVAGGLLAFGSSADDTVYALDAATGEIRWTFCTDAPVRFAPAVWRDRLFVASDDGYLYCLSMASGELHWKRRGAPRDEMLLGNDRMISRWPARGGPVVVDDVVHFGAGIWPSEGIFVYALDPLSGNVAWRNDSSGSIEMDQPHKTARAKSGISAQGYLAAAGEALMVPTGRAVPAVLSRSDGALRQFPLQAHQHAGGADVVIIDDCFANGGAVYRTADGTRIGSIGLQAVVHPKYVIHARDDKLVGLDRHRLTVQREVVDRKGNKQQVTELAPPVWEIPVVLDAHPAPPLAEDLRPPENRMDQTGWTTPALEKEASALVAAGDTVIVGGRGRVSMVDVDGRTVAWSADVEGTAHGLAAADGLLYVSTDRGTIYCFGEADTTPATVVDANQEPLAADPDSPYAKVAEEILRLAEISEGFCVDLGCGDGGLTLELARRTNLRICAVDRDPGNVRNLRQRLHRAGLYGNRVTVHCREPSNVPYADYCADLVVSGRSVTEAPSDVLVAAARRLQCPCGGLLAIGRPGDLNATFRGPLEGAGVWTHQNGSPANTLSSEEQRVTGPLEMLWFRDTDFLMANRHGRAPSALVRDGRMFVEGLNGLRAQSLYNGRVLWEFSAPAILAAYHREHSIGAAWTGGNVCLGPERVFLHDGKACFVLDARTGRQLALWKPPAHPDGKAGVWGYLACHDGVLFGSLAREDYLVKCWSDRWDTGGQFTESTLLFALDAGTGRLLWTFTPEHSIRHNAIALGGGRVYLIDRPLAAEDDRDYVEPPGTVEKRRGVSPAEADDLPPTHAFGRLIALDEKTGERRWESDDAVFGTLLIYSAEHDLLWMGYQAAHQASRGSELGDRMAVFNAADGRRKWDLPAEYDDRPVLTGGTIYAPPGAWDLLTGRKLSFTLDRSYGCGIAVGCRNLLVFRSATLGYVDLTGSAEVQNYGGIRPGCWIPAIPAGGVLAMPDAASWCTCSYLNQGTIVLKTPTAKGGPH
jgi:outer membrane protein assembly factor BamB